MDSSVIVFIDGQHIGSGSLNVRKNQLSWSTPTPVVHSNNIVYSSLLRYGVFPNPTVEDWRNALTLIHYLEGQKVERQVTLYLSEDDLATCIEILMDLVDLEPTFESTLKPQISNELENFTTSTLKTHVTCLKFIDSLLFAGMGDNLLVFLQNDCQSNWTKLITRKIFQGQNIYGIEENGKHLIVYGGKSVSLLRYKFAAGVSQVWVLSQTEVEDWVLDCLWLNAGRSVAFLTANNAVMLYEISVNGFVKSSTIFCSERCILYSGKLLGTNWTDIIVLAGTVFSTIMIWHNDKDGGAVNVIHELEGHKGVIFSITFCEETKQIYSTSDDRTVRVWEIDLNGLPSVDWKNCSISLKFSLYGHSARVWRTNFLGGEKFVSVGEDSQICLWNNDGTLENQWNGHQGGEIWSLAVSETLQLIATGGSDSGISLWPVAKAPVPQVLSMDSPTKNTPRCVGLIDNGTPFMVDNNGNFLLRTKSSWVTFLNDPRFSSYCLHAINPDRKMVAFGSILGHVLICRFSTGSMTKVLDAVVCDGRIFSLIWINCDTLSICEPDGVFTLWTIKSYQVLEKISSFVLPQSKERWITSCAADDLHVVCGDRCGSLYLYSKSGNENPIFWLKRIHGPNGVTDIKLINKKVFSTGRDGKYREFLIDKDELKLLECCKLNLDWVAAIAETKLLDRLLFCFHDFFFVIWSVPERRQVLKIDCGGGHRSWDCLVNSANSTIYLTYIKGKSVFYCSVPVRDVVSHTVVQGAHPKVINAAALVPWLNNQSDDKNMVILGGEDTTLRLVSLGSNSENQLSVLQSHLSSVRSVVCHRSNFHEDLCYVVSGGGRGQLVVWNILHSKTPSILAMIELISHCVISTSSKNQEVTRDSAEMRLMDLEFYENSREILTIIAACSDGFLRIFSYNTQQRTINHVQDVIRGHCLLKILYIQWELPFLISACTSGLLVFHRTSNDSVDDGCDVEENQYSVSDSGLNSCDYELSGDHLIVSCAGDDAHVNIIDFTLTGGQFTAKSHWKNETAHTCQVTGLKMHKNWLFTAGLDQRLAAFSWNLAGGKLEASLITCFNLCVPDVHGISVWKRNDDIYVFVHGLGTQLLTFSCD